MFIIFILLSCLLADLKLQCKVQLGVIERNGVKYLVVDDLEPHESISDGSINIIVEDPEQQPIGKFHSVYKV